MGKKKASKRIADSQLDSGDGEIAQHDAGSIEDGKVVDYITGNQVKDSPKEKVRQRISRAIFHEYGFSPNDMQPDFKVNVGGRRKGVDIAIFQTGSEHTLDNLHRMVICKPEPKQGRKGSFKLRDHEQATRDLDELKDLMEAAPSCQWGLWTNGMEFFFLRKDMPVIAEEYHKFRQKHPVPGV